MSSIGWDIGGVNIKVARVAGKGPVVARTRPFSIERDADQLARALRALATEVGALPSDAHAVTMTAELSQRFRAKAEGVDVVLDALEAAFPGAAMRVLDTSGSFVSLHAAREAPLSVAASNWVASALVVARELGDAFMIDMGSTTTDIIPIEDGAVRAIGLTDPDRLASGELVYTGALRTPVEALVRSVPWQGGLASVAAEGFAHTSDVHLWLGSLAPALHTAPTADGRPATRDFAGERLARVVCADRSMTTEAGITAIAEWVAAAQQGLIADAIERVRARHPRVGHAVVLGIGASLAAAAAGDAGLQVMPLDERWHPDASHAAPATAVAMLMEGATGA
jgi:(4-(4-[2-(gamma-L-glutamylamino)ethyl]phenoxymethyl)furan-2-yl)methanamine synthase